MTYCSKQWLLDEALRRWKLKGGLHIIRSGGQTLTTAWTGLGSATQYKPVLNAGLMEHATAPNPGHATWFRLTEKGAEIVQKMMADQSFQQQILTNFEWQP